MKKSSLTLISLLTLSGTVFGQTASSLVTSSSSRNGEQHYAQSGSSTKLALCSDELCFLDENGAMMIESIEGESVSGLISQASQANANKFLVFYPAGQDRHPSERRILRNRYLVTLSEGADLDAVQDRCGMKSIELIHAGTNLALCEEDSAGRVLGQLNKVLSDPEVIATEAIFAKTRNKRFVPADPMYLPENEVDAAAGNFQWYLKNPGVNGGVPGIDINLEPVIGSGAGVTVGIIDDGVAFDHEEFIERAYPLINPDDPDNPDARQGLQGVHLNLLDGDLDDPATFSTNATHGTGIAGLIGAAFNNGVGISGVAPGVNLSGIRLLSGAGESAGSIDDIDEARALGFRNDEIDIYNSSWGPSDTTLSLEGPGPLALGALRNGVELGRDAKGVIYVWAGGNGGGINDRSDYDGYANSKYTIAVGSVDDGGGKANYSEEGSNIVVTAPSSGGRQSILTTSYGLDVDDDDAVIRTSAYDPAFGQSSASAALVSGVVALMLEANPDLNWREVQDILIRSAVQVDINGGDWIMNGAGLSFSHKYGAGLVDAEAAVQMARDIQPDDRLGDPQRHVLSKFFVEDSDDPLIENGLIPDNNGSSLLVGFDMASTTDLGGNLNPNLKVEHVEFQATIVTESRSDLEVVLISPNGTQSILHAVDLVNDDQSIYRWTFMSVRNWGEGSAGTWRVRVTDLVTGSQAFLNNATLVINGTVDPGAPVASTPILTSNPFISVNQNEDFSYQLETAGAASVVVGVLPDNALPDGVTYDATTGLISGAATGAGLFKVIVRMFDDAGAISESIITIVVRPTAVALGGALGFDYPAVFGGDAPWDFELANTNSGVGGSAARSAVGLADGESSILGFDNIPRGVIMFDWVTSSEEGADRLWFNQGGEVPHAWDAFISGSRQWTTSAVILPEQSNTLRWIYEKDATKAGGLLPNAVGEDRGLIDNVKLIEMGKYMDDLIAAGGIAGFTPEFDSRMIFYPVEIGVGDYAIASPSIGNGQTASISAWIEGPGTFDARVGVYADASDTFEFVVDGVVLPTESQPGIGGGFVLKELSYPILEGRHRIQLRFRKDISITAFGEVAGVPFEGIVIDGLKFTPESSFASFLNGIDQTYDDGDEYSHYQEYAFGGDVSVADTPKYLPKLVTSGGKNYIEYGFNTALKSIDYTAQQSSDLTDWVDAELATLDRKEGDVDVYRIPVTSGAGRAKLFYRVQVADK